VLRVFEQNGEEVAGTKRLAEKRLQFSSLDFSENAARSDGRKRKKKSVPQSPLWRPEKPLRTASFAGVREAAMVPREEKYADTKNSMHFFRQSCFGEPMQQSARSWL
jgi:hypothetical protein